MTVAAVLVARNTALGRVFNCCDIAMATTPPSLPPCPWQKTPQQHLIPAIRDAAAGLPHARPTAPDIHWFGTSSACCRCWVSGDVHALSLPLFVIFLPARRLCSYDDISSLDAALRDDRPACCPHSGISFLVIFKAVPIRTISA